MSDVAATPQQHQVPNDNNVRDLLTMARQLINQGKPSQALQAMYAPTRWAHTSQFKHELVLTECLGQVVSAMRTNGGDQAVFQSLHRARQLYLNRLQENTAVDQLASLFAECAIAEAQPLEPEQIPFNVAGESASAVPDVHVNSILAETGRTQIVLDAFSDGSSFICLQCGGLVSNHRKDEHYAYWCGKL
ncbi:unnamed protein product [Dovyalis caffra]|uniref:C2HC zinc finger plants domain-containing protein n=1 Tax=Dovyalis caffra TaxID=77055 RepID=A0AAV1S9C4_9ROSI|nr:unnamed protein product [Dovyalis caffra]